MIVNLTPHVIRLNDGREYPPSGAVARVTASHGEAGWLSGGPDGPSIRLFRVEYGEIQGLPAPEGKRHCDACSVNGAGAADCAGPGPEGTCSERTWYIVSAIVAQAAKGRDDILVPATGHPDAIRKEGQIFSVPGFVRG